MNVLLGVFRYLFVTFETNCPIDRIIYNGMCRHLSDTFLHLFFDSKDSRMRACPNGVQCKMTER